MIKFRHFKLIGLVCILTFALVFIGFHFLQAQGNSKKDKPPGKPKPPPPELLLDYCDIITTGENALSVWNFQADDPIWSTETPGYRAVAVGDADNDVGTLEIVVPRYKEVKVGKGKEAKSYIKIFLDVYKEGVSGIWKSTEDYEINGDKGYFLEDELYSHTEIMIADVDSVPGNEVIVLSYHNLAVFKYEGSNFVIEARTTSADLTDTSESNFEAVTAGDVPSDETSLNRIIVSIYDSINDSGYVCLLNQDLSLNPNDKIPVTITDNGEEHKQIFFSHRSLRLAELDGDENDDQEICTIGYYGYRVDECEYLQWKPYVIVLDWEGANWGQTVTLLEGWVGIECENYFPYTYLDTGDLIEGDNPSEEIVVSANLPGYSGAYQLILYSYDGILITPPLIGPSIQARISNIEVGNVDGNGANGIVVAGRVNLPGGAVFYLEVFDSNLNTLWERIGEKKEGRIIDTAIVK